MLNTAKVETFMLTKPKYLHNLSSTSGSKREEIRDLDPSPKYFTMPPPQNNFAVPPQPVLSPHPQKYVCHQPQKIVLPLHHNSMSLIQFQHLCMTFIYACKSAKKTQTI